MARKRYKNAGSRIYSEFEYNDADSQSQAEAATSIYEFLLGIDTDADGTVEGGQIKLTEDEAELRFGANYLLIDASGITTNPAIGGGGGNSFETIDCPAGTDPVADSPTDTLQLLAGSTKITITGDSVADSVTFDVDESQIDLANLGTKAHSSLTGIGANDHHNESHTHVEADITDLLHFSPSTLDADYGDETITNLFTFDRDPGTPFAVTASSAVVTNLDADLLDGNHASSFAGISHTHVEADITDLDHLIEDDAYGSGWNDDTTHAPSQNAVYDQMEQRLNINQPYVWVRKNQNQTINNATWTAILFNSSDVEESDNLGFHDPTTNNTRFTVPSGYDGVYEITCHVSWTANNGGRRIHMIKKNGGNTALGRVEVSPSQGEHHVVIKATKPLVAGDYIELFVYQSSGAGLATRSQATWWELITEVTMVRIAEGEAT